MRNGTENETHTGPQVYERPSGKWSMRYMHGDGTSVNHDWLVADDWRRAIYLSNCNDVGINWIVFADGRTVSA